MDHPTWILVPWAVFALSAAAKVWQLFARLRQRRPNTTNGLDSAGGLHSSGIEQMRSRLERIWNQDSLSQS